MAENRNEKEVLLKVRTDTSEANSGLEEVKGKIEQANETARELSRVDYGSMSVKELKEQLDKAEMSMEQLAKSGNATEAAMKVLGDRVDEINKGLTSIGTNKATQTFEANMRVAIGAVESVGGALTFIGVESETANEALARMAGLMSFTNGIKDMVEYGQKVGITQKAVIGWEKVQKMANTTLGKTKLALAGLGIGLIITAVSYLVEYWDELTEGFEDMFPSISGLTEKFGDFKAILVTVGQTVVGTIMPVIKNMVSAFSNAYAGIKQVFSGDITGGLKSLGQAVVDASPLNHITSMTKGLIDGVKSFGDNLEANKARLAKNNEEVEEEVEESNSKIVKSYKSSSAKIKDTTEDLYKTLAGYIKEAEREILEATTDAKKLELMDIRAKYAERIALAEKLGEDTSALIKAQEIEEQAIKDKYAEEAIKKAEQQAKEEEQARLKGKQEALSSAKLSGETGVIEAENMDDGTVEGLNRITGARQAALLERYVAERELYADDQEMLNNLKAKYTQESLAIDKQHNEAQRRISEATKNAKLADMMAISNAMGAISSLLGEQTVAGKALGVAQATIDTYVGANKALAQGGFAGIAMAASVIATGLVNVKKILSTKVEGVRGGGTRGGSTATSGGRTAPVINTTVLNRGETEDLNSLGNNDANPLNTAPIRAYIVDRDIQESRNKNELTDNLSTF